MAKAYGLSEKDVALMKEIANWYRKRVAVRARIDGAEEDTLPGPDGEVVLAPVGGIPALTSGTPDEPGIADCAVYDLIDDTLIESAANPLTVHNVSDSEIPEGSYALVRRTRRGLWVVDQPVSGSGLTFLSATTAGDTVLTGTMANVLNAISIPSAGTYLFFGALGWYVSWGLTQTDPVVGESISIKLRDTTNSVDVMEERSVVGKYIVFPGEQAETNFTRIYTFGGGLTYPLSLRLQAKCGVWGSNPQGVVTALITPNSPQTRLSCVRVA